MPVQESWTAMEANSTAESRVGGGAITVASRPYNSQQWQLNKRGWPRECLTH